MLDVQALCAYWMLSENDLPNSQTDSLNNFQRPRTNKLKFLVCVLLNWSNWTLLFGQR
jgi:hypothetical protein